jgi:putative transposase
MTTKVVKIQIIKPLDSTWEEFGTVLNEIQYNTYRFSNKTMQMYWDYSNFSQSYKERFGKKLDFHDDLQIPKQAGKGHIKGIESDIPVQLKDLTKNMCSYGLSATLTMVKKKWEADFTDMVNGRKSIANFKRDMPIEIHNIQMMDKRSKEIWIRNESGDYSVDLMLISKEYAKEINRDTQKFKVALAVKDSYQKAIVDRVINGEYKLSMSKLIKDKRKKKWFLNLAYTFTPEKETLQENKILGIDLGVKIPAMLAISDNKFFRESVGSSEEITNFQKQVTARTKSLQRQRKWCGEGSIGHGTKTRIKPIEKLSGKIKRFKDTKNHNWSRYIVEQAIKNNCGTIQMEDLSGIAEENTFLKTWTYYDLQQKIKYKAEEKGIKIVMINPYKTSQRCSKCGRIHKDNRETQEKFKCVECGFETNADWNAAKNIATPNIEKIIEEQMKKQEKELKHNMKYAI